MVGFIFGAPGLPTYDELQRRKQIAAQLMARRQAMPKNVGEGLTAIGEAISDVSYENRIKRDEEALRAKSAQEGAPPTPETYSYEPDAPAVPPTRSVAPAATTPGPGASLVPPGTVASAPGQFQPPPAYLASRLEELVSDPNRRAYLGHLAGREARNPNEVSSTGAAGPFQFTRSTGAQYGIPGNDRFDVDKSILAANSLTDDNAAVLTKALGREPTPGELALAHQQGAGTAAKMLLGTGNASANNLAVNNVSGGLGPQAAAQRIMSYYGMPGSAGPRGEAAAILASRTADTPATAADAQQENLLGDVTGMRRAPPSFGSATAANRTGNIMNDADPVSPTGALGGQAGQSVGDTVQQRSLVPPQPAIQQPPQADPRLAQANPFPNPNVATDAPRAILPGGGLPQLPPVPQQQAAPPPPPPPAQVNPGIRKAPEFPDQGPAPAFPPLLPMNTDYTKKLEAQMNNPYLDPGSRQRAKDALDTARSEIKSVNDYRIGMHKEKVKNYDAAINKTKDPTTILSVEKARRELEADVPVPLTPEQRKAYGIPDNLPAAMTRDGKIQYGPAGSSVSVNTAGEKEESKVSGKLAAERKNEMIQAANKSGEDLVTHARAEALLNRITTGALEPNRTTVAAIGRSLGVSDDFMKGIGLKPEEIGSRQAFQAIVNELTMGKIGAGGMPANNFSEGDRKFLERTMPGMGDEDEANRIKLAASRRVRELHIEKADAWGDFQEANPNKGYEEFERRWMKDLKQRNTFGDLQQKAENLVENAQRASAEPGIPGDLPTKTTPLNAIVSDGDQRFRRTDQTKSGWERVK